MQCGRLGVWSLSWEDPLEKGMTTHSSILAWRIPWTVWSMWSQRVGYNWATFTSLPWFQSIPLYVHLKLPLVCPEQSRLLHKLWQPCSPIPSSSPHPPRFWPHWKLTISKCAPAMLVLMLLLQVLWLKFPYFTRRDLRSHVFHAVWFSRLVWSFCQSLSCELLLPWAILINTHVHFTLCKWYCVESVKQMASLYSKKGSQVENRWYICLRFAIF